METQVYVSRKMYEALKEALMDFIKREQVEITGIDASLKKGLPMSVTITDLVTKMERIKEIKGFIDALNKLKEKQKW